MHEANCAHIAHDTLGLSAAAGCWPRGCPRHADGAQSRPWGGLHPDPLPLQPPSSAHSLQLVQPAAGSGHLRHAPSSVSAAAGRAGRGCGGWCRADGGDGGAGAGENGFEVVLLHEAHAQRSPACLHACLHVLFRCKADGGIRDAGAGEVPESTYQGMEGKGMAQGGSASALRDYICSNNNDDMYHNDICGGAGGACAGEGREVVVCGGCLICTWRFREGRVEQRVQL
eukprot:scaffold32485_cov20-Tisochrysis_lutea.AAC.4